METNPTLDTNQLKTAIRLNEEYQNFVKEQIQRVELAMKRNQELQKKIKTIITQSKSGKKATTTVDQPLGPLFVDQAGEQPPDNADVTKKQSEMENFPLFVKLRKWTEQEIKELAKGVRQQNQELLSNALLEQFQHKSDPRLEEYNESMEKIKSLPDSDLELNQDGLDWKKIAKVYVPSRSALECMIRWVSHDHPAISKRPWSKEEDQLLAKLAKEHRGFDWNVIAQQLNSGRTEIQCFRRWQRSLNTSVVNSKWTAKEDELLSDGVKKFGQKNWQQVAHQVPGRTGQQCLNRWQKVVNPSIRRGRWTLQEDLMLSVAVQSHGEGNWIKVQQHVPGRTDMKCRERWMNVLKPVVNNGPWTPEEDQLLKEAVEKCGKGKWALIAHYVADKLHQKSLTTTTTTTSSNNNGVQLQKIMRTDNQCWRRWKLLFSGEEVNSYMTQVKKKRSVIPSNFVGREKEKPKDYLAAKLSSLQDEEDEKLAAIRSKIAESSPSDVTTTTTTTTTATTTTSAMIVENDVSQPPTITTTTTTMTTAAKPRRKRTPAPKHPKKKHKSALPLSEDEDEDEDEDDEGLDDDDY